MEYAGTLEHYKRQKSRNNRHRRRRIKSNQRHRKCFLQNHGRKFPNLKTELPMEVYIKAYITPNRQDKKKVDVM